MESAKVVSSDFSTVKLVWMPFIVLHKSGLPFLTDGRPLTLISVQKSGKCKPYFFMQWFRGAVKHILIIKNIECKNMTTCLFIDSIP